MLEINLNPQFAELLKHHDIKVHIDDEFINSDLPDNVKFKARAVYQEVNKSISSRLDVMILTDKGEPIFNALPTLPKLKFYSCRNFIILKDKAAD